MTPLLAMIFRYGKKSTREEMEEMFPMFFWVFKQSGFIFAGKDAAF